MYFLAAEVGSVLVPNTGMPAALILRNCCTADSALSGIRPMASGRALMAWSISWFCTLTSQLGLQASSSMPKNSQAFLAPLM